MEWIKVINDAIEFMEKNLTEEIGLLEVARSVNISAFHFHHAFTIMTGITPAEYIRNRRLTLAGLELADGSSKIIDIALKYGYETPESFTKAFSRFHGFSPMQVRKGSPLKSMNRYTVRITIDGGTIMEYKIEKWDELDLLVHFLMRQRRRFRGILEFVLRAAGLAGLRIRAMFSNMELAAGRVRLKVWWPQMDL